MPKVNKNNDKDVAMRPVWLEFATHSYSGDPEQDGDYDTAAEEACPTCGARLGVFVPDDSRCEKCRQLIDYTWPDAAK